MAFEIVVMTETGMVRVHPDSIEEWAEDNCHEIVGVHDSARTRPELQGHPKLRGFAGPCWGGTTETGDPVIRYEDAESYAALSL